MTVAADALMRQVRYIPNPKFSGLCGDVLRTSDSKGLKICDFRVA
jgi:hypothetical protein